MTDSLSILFQRRHVVLLKMNPVNDYLHDVFQRIFEPVVQRGWMQIINGDTEIGTAACQHEAVDEIHITGSHHTHDAIVWGPPAERAVRKQSNTPLLNKPITSELGNVTPWVIVPGTYTEKELRFQAINIAAALVNNAGFNCLTPRVLVTGSEWRQRNQFLTLLKETLQQIPERVPYYAGARERYAKLTGHELPADAATLPWTLIEGLSPDEPSSLLSDESFVCICAEVSLEGASDEFLKRSVDFCNNSLFGTLCAAITMPDAFWHAEQPLIHQAILDMNYGSVCINQWPGLVYGLMTPPWGAAPGSSLRNVQSGIGNVHNLYFLDAVEKTVFYGPLCNWPKPIWFPSHTRAEQIAWELMGFYENPSVWNLPKLLVPALLG